MNDRTRYCSRCLTTFTEDAARCPSLSCDNARPADGWGELLAPGQLLDRTYRIEERLAIGGAGVTYLAREVDPQGEPTGPKLAIKVLYAQRDTGAYLRRLATEAQILQGLRHGNIVECRGFVQRAGHSPYLVTRFEEGGTLLDHLGRVGTLPTGIVAQVGRQLCWGLSVAHAQGVIHRDLKPENVLLTKRAPREEVPELRIADFGIAKVTGAVGAMTRVGAFVGTPSYAAPEQFDGLPPEPATDVYALGAVLLYCLTGRNLLPPTTDLDLHEQREHLVRSLPPTLPDVREQRSSWEALLSGMMALEPRARVSLVEAERQLGALAEGRSLVNVDISVAAEAGTDSRPFTRAGVTTRSEPTVLPDSTGAFARGSNPAATQEPPPLPAAPAGGQASNTPATNPTTTHEAPRAYVETGTNWKVPLVLLGLSAMVCTGAAGAWLWASRTPEVVTLTGKETDPTMVADWKAVAGELGRRGPAAARACNAPANPQVEIRVGGDGALKGLRVLQSSDEALAGCLSRALSVQAFPRVGGSEVKVAVTLP